MLLKILKFTILLAALAVALWLYDQKSGISSLPLDQKPSAFRSYKSDLDEHAAKKEIARPESLDSENFELALPTKTPATKFAIPEDPKLARLRGQLMKPWRRVDTEAKAFVQQSAMSDLARMRTREAAFVLAELLFADQKEYYITEYINGVKTKSVSYSVMIYLEKMLEKTPPPLDGRNFADADLPVWQAWWNSNKDKLIFRELKNPQ